MSYCRFSSNNCKCDVYAYEAESGFTVHVAASRLVDEIPPLLHILSTPNEEWFASYQKQAEAIRKSPHKNIGGIYDGKSFSFDTLPELLACLLDIREHGYIVPDFVIEDIEEEIKEEKGGD